MFEVLIAIYIATVIVFFVVSVPDIHDCPSTPRQVYESGNLNMFGSAVVWIIVVILDPLLFVAKFIYWIFHVGRT